MSLAWSSVKALSIPLGGVSRDVKRVTAGGVVLWEKAPAVPYDAEVEYLESTGTQYIDTGIYATLSTVFSLVFSPTNPATSNWVFGARSTTSDRFGLFFDPSSISIQVGSVVARPSASITAAKHALSLDRHTLILDGTSYAVGAGNAFTGAYPVFVCTLNNDGAAYGQCPMRLYACAIHDGSTLVRDFISVRVGSGANAVGYLYDRANPTGGPLGNGLYPNSGTGAFVVGPDYGTSLSMSPFLELVETDLNPSDATATT